MLRAIGLSFTLALLTAGAISSTGCYYHHRDVHEVRVVEERHDHHEHEREHDHDRR